MGTSINQEAAVAEHIGDAAEPRVDEQGFWIEVEQVALQKRGFLQRNLEGVVEPRKQPFQLFRIEEGIPADHGLTLSKGHERAVEVKGAPQGIAVVFVQFQPDDLFVREGVRKEVQCTGIGPRCFEGREFGASRHPHGDGVAKEKHIAPFHANIGGQVLDGLSAEKWRNAGPFVGPVCNRAALSEESVFDDHPDISGEHLLEFRLVHGRTTSTPCSAKTDAKPSS